MRNAAITTTELLRSFGDLVAVDGLSLEVPRGAVFGLLGPNGAGKTTTIRLLLGLLPPTAGDAEVLGCDSRRDGERIRQMAGVLFEHTGLYERLTAWENLEFYGRVWGLAADVRRKRSQDLLSHFDLLDRSEDRVATWSRGMKQKLGIARTLIHRPQIVFLDEPTAGLDPETAVLLREDIVSLAARDGTTVLLTTHNLAEADEICDHVAIIRSGRLVASGAKGHVISATGRPHIRLVGRGISEAALQTVRALPQVISANLVECGDLIVELEDRADSAPIIRAIIENGGEVLTVHSPKPSLQDTYLALSRQADD